MPADEQKTQESAGISADADPDRPVDVGALLERLREEGSGPSDRRALRDEAERLWPVSADRSLRLRPGVRGGLATPLKAVLRKLMRWYVEPVAYDQRSFNAVTLRLIDDLDERLSRIETEQAGSRGDAADR
ncbi:MAG: hypothetical protein E6G67_05585 [Actinobacteria bacterium]|nr:MAG: hypothetical protein E6G67_05585 [Actinomycetota bacterium]